MLNAFKNSSLFKNIASKLPSTPLQEKVDIYRAALTLKCYEVCKKSASGTLSADDVEKFTREADKTGHSKLTQFVHDQIHAQILDLYNTVDNSEEDLNEFHSNVPLHVRKQKEREVLLKGLKYCVDIKASGIPNAGEGVFISTPDGVVPGTIVSLYPGKVFLKEYLRDEKYFSQILPDPEFMLMTRLDESIIDGRSALQTPYNPFATGHKINHCGTDRRPNVMQVSFDYAQGLFGGNKFPLHLRRYIPNKYDKLPSFIGKMSLPPGTLMPGVVLVATRHLSDGDELLMDYRLDPDSANLPAWYTAYDQVEARNRWA